MQAVSIGGENGHPEGEDYEPEDGVRWEFDGDGESHVPEEQEDNDDSDNSTDSGS